MRAHAVTHPNHLSRIVRDLRTQRGWTQTELAARAGVSLPWLSRFENLKPTAEIGLVLKVLKALGHCLAVEPSRPSILERVPHAGSTTQGEGAGSP